MSWKRSNFIDLFSETHTQKRPLLVHHVECLLRAFLKTLSWIKRPSFMENFKSFNYLFISYKISEELIWNCHTILYNVNDHRIWNKISFLDVKKSTVFFSLKSRMTSTLFWTSFKFCEFCLANIFSNLATLK